MTEATRLRAVDETLNEPYQGKWWRRFHTEPVPAEKTPKTGTARANLREIGSTFVEIAGIGSISAGAWLISPPAGLITAGVGAIVLGIAAAQVKP